MTTAIRAVRTERERIIGAFKAFSDKGIECGAQITQDDNGEPRYAIVVTDTDVDVGFLLGLAQPYSLVAKTSIRGLVFEVPGR